MTSVLIMAASTGRNMELAEMWAGVCRSLDMGAEIVDLCGLGLPLFTPELQKEGAPEGLLELEKQMHAADSWVVCAPEYNGSFPPSLNNAIAWLSTNGEDFRALFNGKPVALSSHSGGGGQSVMLAMRQQFSYLGSNVLGRTVLSNRNKEANPEAMEILLEQLRRMS